MATIATTELVANGSNDDRSPNFIEVPINRKSVTGELSGELPGVEFRNTMSVVEPPYTSYGEDGYNGP
jgi:hypothetical protein